MSDITQTGSELLGSSIEFIKENPLISTIGVTGAVVGGVVVASSIIGKSNKRKTKRCKSRNSRKRVRRIKHTKRGWKQDRKRFNKSQKWEVAYRKRKKRKGSIRHSKKIHYAKKTGQPYIILRNGRAKFIKGKRRKQ